MTIHFLSCSPPLVGDSTPPLSGYGVDLTVNQGQLYVDTTYGDLYIVRDASNQSALVWNKMYGGLSNLATVATSGSYNDLSNLPTIPAAPVNADWSAASGLAQILNKPSLSTVATSGAYADLSGKPTLATVASTGSYTDLTNKPTITAQVNSDWNASSGAAQILNKPSLYTPAATVYSSPNFSSITTATQLSSSRDAYVNYVFPTALTSLLASQSLTATLQYADDSGMTTNVITVNADVTGCSGLLNLTLNGRLQVSGRIPAGKYRKVTLVQAGGATVPTTISSSQEVLL